MKRTVLLIALFGVILLPLQAEFQLKLGAGFFTGPKKSEFTFIMPWDTGGVLTASENNKTTLEPGGGLAFELGASYFFTPEWGVGAQLGFFSTDMTVNTQYNWNWTWFNGDKGNAYREWECEGKMDVIPISLNVIYRSRVSDKLTIGASVGPTVFMCSFDLNTKFGTGQLASYQGGYFVDLFVLDLTSELSKSVLGVSASVDVEFALSKKLSLYFATSYYKSGEIEESWRVIPKRYISENQMLYMDIDNPIEHKVLSKIDSYVLSAGVKITL